MDKAEKLARCTITRKEATVNARRCTSENFDGVEYEFKADASIDIPAIIEEVQGWDGQAIEQMIVPPTAEKYDFIVFVADIPEVTLDGGFVSLK